MKRALRVNRRSAVCDSRYKSKNICRSRVRELHDAGKKVTEIRARGVFGDVQRSNRNRSCNRTKRIRLSSLELRLTIRAVKKHGAFRRPMRYFM